MSFHTQMVLMVVGLVVLAIGMTVLLLWMWQRDKLWNTAVDAAAQRFRLKASINPSVPSASFAEGVVKEYDVYISRSSRSSSYGNRTPYAEVKVSPRWLSVTMSVMPPSSSPYTTTDYSKKQSKTSTGYPEIDGSYAVSDVKKRVVKALADGQTRAAFVQFMQAGGMLDCGWLVRQETRIPREGDVLIQQTEALLALADRLYRADEADQSSA